MATAFLPAVPAPRPAQAAPPAKPPAESRPADDGDGGFAQHLRQAREQNAHSVERSERNRQAQAARHDGTGDDRRASKSSKDPGNVDGDDRPRTDPAARAEGEEEDPIALPGSPEAPAALAHPAPEPTPAAAAAAGLGLGRELPGSDASAGDAAGDASADAAGAAGRARPGRALGAHARHEAPGRAVAEARHEAAELRRTSSKDETGTITASEAAGASAAATPASAASAQPRENAALLPPATLGVSAAAPGSPAQAPAAPAHSDGRSAVFETHLAAALDSPGFGPALGSQLRLLVREGVQEARLQLNPADMGPVSVQISVEGVQARVEFRADLAATRSALEASLPDLAAALKDSGLMLAGGGVFEQHRGQADAGPAPAASPGRGSAAVGELGAPAPSAVVRRPQGVVDLFA